MGHLGKRHLILELTLKSLGAKNILAPTVSMIPQEPEATSAFVGMLKSLLGHRGNKDCCLERMEYSTWAKSSLKSHLAWVA